MSAKSTPPARWRDRDSAFGPQPPSPPPFAGPRPFSLRDGAFACRRAAILRAVALLVLFGFVAGAATALSPCVLPVLPVALAAGATGGRRRPLGIVAGLTVSFTLATVVLAYVISALGLPNDLLRKLAIGVLLAFGIVLMIPPLAAR